MPSFSNKITIKREYVPHRVGGRLLQIAPKFLIAYYCIGSFLKKMSLPLIILYRLEVGKSQQ
jgi:hypothetical protein